ncbi:MAG: glycosyltransferase [Clostridia bacterium]|nr:glycosyltransferase [Clostridia bacterium]
MKVALVTSWPPRWCGIAAYSSELAAALEEAGAEVHVVCHTDGGRPGEARVHPVIDQERPDWFWPLLNAVAAIDPDVVHVQHEFGLYSLLRDRVYDFEPANAFEIAVPLFRWRLARRPTVVTYHSVFSRHTFDEAEYYDHCMGLAAANIVHEPFQREALPYNLGRVPDNVFVIPHGAGRRRPRPEEVRRARAALGLRNETVVGLMGWWEPNKGFERVVDLWPAVVQRVPEAILILAGAVRPGSPTGEAERTRYLAAVAASPARDRIRVVEGRFPPEEYRRVLAAFDLMVLPYRHASQSGNLAHAYEAALPVVVTAVEGLRSSVEASGAGLIARDERELVEAIVRLAGDAALRRQMSRNAARYVRTTVAWDRVARRHLAVYRWARRRVLDPRRYARYEAERLHV